MNSQITWILVASSVMAKIYSTEKLQEEWHLVKELDHPEGRERDVDLVADKPGKYRTPMEPSSSAFDERTDPKFVEDDNFARTVADELDKGRSQNAYGKIIVVAPPRFHGMLMKHCDSHTKSLVVKHLEKDYTRLAERELISYIQAQL